MTTTGYLTTKEKPVSVWLRLSPALAQLIKDAAKKDKRSVTQWCAIQLETSLKELECKKVAEIAHHALRQKYIESGEEERISKLLTKGES